MLEKIKKEMLKDYRETVFECLYYAYKSWMIEKEIDIIKKDYKIEITDNYEKDILKFNHCSMNDLKNILNILNIEANDEWTNSNRCEASAIILWEYLRKIENL